MERTVLITGASSGLGLAFVTHYAAHPSTRVLALDIAALPAPASTLENVWFYEVDVRDEGALSVVAEDLKGGPVHLLIHCAGTRGLVPSCIAEKKGVPAAETLAVMDRTTFTHTFETNTWSLVAVSRVFLPHLKKAASYASTTGAHPPKLVVLSSRMGSIAGNSIGGGYGYRASKAALNAVVKSLSVDLREEGIVVLAVHPGRVATGLVGWKEEGAIGVGEALEGCLKIVRRTGMRETGQFVDRFGEVIPW